MKTLLRVATILALVGPSSAGQTLRPILSPDIDQLRSQAALPNTGLQNMALDPSACGVNLDGSEREPNQLGLAMSANLWQDGLRRGAANGIVRLLDGAFAPTDIDFALPTRGPAVVIGRTFFHGAFQGEGNPPIAADAIQGWNWFQTAWPEIVVRASDDRVFIVYGGDRHLAFQRVPESNPATYRGVNGAAGAVVKASGEGGQPDLWIYYDAVGNHADFIASGSRSGRLWRIVDGAGRAMSVGNAGDAAQACASGFDELGRVVSMTDGAGRRFEFAYGSGRLTQVDVTAPDTTTRLATISYSYYDEAAATGSGRAGDLKLVHVEIGTESDAQHHLHRYRYYRYWTQAHAAEHPGFPHLPRLIVEEEGCRGFDAATRVVPAMSLESRLDAAADAALGGYASLVLEYDSSGHVARTARPGDATHAPEIKETYAYGLNRSFAASTGAYTPTWKSRTIVRHSDTAWTTCYFDEAGQSLGVLVSDDAPTGDPALFRHWNTDIHRDAMGCVDRVATPASMPRSAVAPSDPDALHPGLVMAMSRVDSGPMAGFLRAVTVRNGADDPTSAMIASTTYLGEASGGATTTPVTRAVSASYAVVRPLVASVRQYKTEAGNPLTTFEYTTYPDALGIKQLTVHPPAVSTARNGDGREDWTRRSYFTPDGLVQFAWSPLSASTGRVDYFEYDDTTGRVRRSVQDAATSMDCGVASIPDGFATTVSDPLRRQREYTYDAWGRLHRSSDPAGRVAQLDYSVVSDGRPVVIEFPRVDLEGGGSLGTRAMSQWYGPARCSALTLDGLPSGSLLVSPKRTRWNDLREAYACSLPASLLVNPSATAGPGQSLLLRSIGAEETPGLVRGEFVECAYTPNGRSLLGVARYTSIAPEALAFDLTQLSYDGRGRLVQTTTPAGTIQPIVYDDATGRVVGMSRGTNAGNLVPIVGYFYGDESPTEHAANGLVIEEQKYNAAPGTNGQYPQGAIESTRYTYDYRGRAIAVQNPAAPHSLLAYDNQSRLTSVALLAEWPFSVGDPLLPIYAANGGEGLGSRRALATWSYDERGRVCLEQRANIDQTTGAIVAPSVDAPWQSRASVYAVSGAVARVTGGCIGCGGGSLTAMTVTANSAGEPIKVSFFVSTAPPANYDEACQDINAHDYELEATYYIRDPRTGEVDAILRTERGPQPTDACVQPGAGGHIFPGQVPSSTSTSGGFTLNPFGGTPGSDANLMLHMIWRDPLGREIVAADWGYTPRNPDLSNSLFPLVYSSDVAAGAWNVGAANLYANSAYPARYSTTFYNELGQIENTSGPGGAGRFQQYDDAGRETGSGRSWSPLTGGSGLGISNLPSPAHGYAACQADPSQPPIPDSTNSYDKGRLVCSSTAGALGANRCIIFQDHREDIPASQWPFVEPSHLPAGDQLRLPAAPSNDLAIGMAIRPGGSQYPTDRLTYEWYTYDAQGRKTDSLWPGRLHTTLTFDPYGRPRERVFLPLTGESGGERRLTDSFDGLGRVVQHEDFSQGAGSPLTRRRFDYDAFGNPRADFTEIFPAGGGQAVLGMALKQEFRSRDLLGAPGSFLGGSNVRTPTRIELPGGMILQPWYGTCSLNSTSTPYDFLSNAGVVGQGAASSLDLSAVLARPSRVDLWPLSPTAPIAPFSNPTNPFNEQSIRPASPAANSPPEWAMRYGYHGIAYPSWFEQPMPGTGGGNLQQPTDVCSCLSPSQIPTSPGRNPYGEPISDPWRICAGTNPCDPNSYPDSRGSDGDYDWQEQILFRGSAGSVLSSTTPPSSASTGFTTTTTGANPTSEHTPIDYCMSSNYNPDLDDPRATIEAKQFPGLETSATPLRHERIRYGRDSQRLTDYTYTLAPRAASQEWKNGSAWDALLETPAVDGAGNPASVRFTFAHEGDLGHPSSIHPFRIADFTRTVLGGGPGSTYTPVYDALGNLTDDGVAWAYDFDALGNLERVFRRDPGAALHRGRLFARFRHDASGRMISAVYDLASNAVADPQADAVFDDETIEYYGYDDRDRLVCVWRQGAMAGGVRPAPRVYQRIVHRTGGRGMSGEGWFLDAPIYAQVDRDGDGVFELEYRYLQSAVSGDIIGFLPSSGPGSRLEYSMFGVPRYAAGARGNFGADVDDGTGTGTPDGGVDINDLTYFLALYDAGDERVDLDNGSGLGLPDGGTDVNDLLYFLTLYEAGARGGDLSDLRFAWRGYVWDARLQLYHVRHRAFDPKLMVWLQPDPLGDVDGPNPYAYVGWDPFGKMDPYGLEGEAWYEGWGRAIGYLFGGGPEGSAGQVWGAAWEGNGISRVWRSLKGEGSAELANQLELSLLEKAGIAADLAGDPVVGEAAEAYAQRGREFQQIAPMAAGLAEASVMFTIMPGLNIRNSMQLAADVSKGAAVVSEGEKFFVVTADGKRAEVTAEQAKQLEVLAEKARALTGDGHHLISKKVHDALEEHEVLKGIYKYRDDRFLVRAVDKAAHNGYEKWHIRLDGEVVQWLRKNEKATPEQFEQFLRERYSQPDLRAKFPSQPCLSR